MTAFCWPNLGVLEADIPWRGIIILPDEGEDWDMVRDCKVPPGPRCIELPDAGILLRCIVVPLGVRTICCCTIGLPDVGVERPVVLAIVRTC